MKSNGVEPGLIVYTCLIQTCIKSKDMETSLKLYREMSKAKILGDTVFYNTLISGLIFNHMTLQSLEIVLEAFKNKIRLNPEVSQNLVWNLSRKNMEDLADYEEEILNLFKYLNKFQIDVDEHHYNAIIRKIMQEDTRQYDTPYVRKTY